MVRLQVSLEAGRYSRTRTQTRPSAMVRRVRGAGTRRHHRPFFGIPWTLGSCDKIGRVRVPETQYARNGDVSLAYQVVGSGPVDRVYVPGGWSNVERNWEDGDYARFL